MLWKLSITGLKSRFKDYAVLFSGLTLAAAIFYMFLTLALNPSFLKKAIPLAYQQTSFIFGFGTVLLVMITFVYIVYANSFLLSMRKRDYGMYMMLGARNSKIGHLIFMETIIVGLLATVLGIVIGILLTQLVSGLLISQLGLSIHHFVGLYFPAILWTIIFFALLFFFAALWNRVKLIRTNVINLIHEDQKPVKLRSHKVWKIIEAILGIALVAAGYLAMAKYTTLQLASIPIALFTIVLGSYFIFSSFFTTIIDLLRKNKKYAYRGLHTFTLGQLKFRITDYNRILTVVSLLFALALGAITVGLNFNNLTDEATKTAYYDVELFQKNAQVKQGLKQVSVRDQTNLDYKVVTKTVKKGDTQTFLYVSKSQIDQAKIKAQIYQMKNGQPKYFTRRLTSENLQKSNKNSGINRYYLLDLTPYGSGADAQLMLVSQKQFANVKAPKQRIDLLRVNNFKQDFKKIEKLQKAALTPAVKDGNLNLKTDQYRIVLTMASGFEFMGFFLGLAFLAMLASTLMFKVLSGANSDKPRYEMLWKIGTQNKLLKHSIAKEIGTLFALPAVLGVIDVLFGLQFFRSLLPNPYDKIWIPFTLFLVLYVVYYLITVKLYEGIVLRKN